GQLDYAALALPGDAEERRRLLENFQLVGLGAVAGEGLEQLAFRHRLSDPLDRPPAHVISSSGRKTPSLTRASSAAQLGAPGGAVSATTQSTFARRSALASASTSATGSPPRRSGTVGNPSVTTTRSGIAFGCLKSSWRRSVRPRRRASASGVWPLSGIERSRRWASAALAVRGNAMVPQGTAPLKATSATRTPLSVQ